MGIVMFVIFLLTDLFTVLICKYAYAKRDQYAEGMIMGVHIPAEEVNNEEVQKICRESRKVWNRFHRVNLALGCLVCGLCFYGLEVFVLVWMIWLLVYLAVTYYLVILPHRQMYQVKMRNHWVNTGSMHKVCIDTELAAMSGKMVYNWKWHLPAAAMILASGVMLVRSGTWFVQDNTGWILLAAALGITLIFLVFHLWFAGRRNIVYSQNTEVNFAVNQAVKRAWTGGFLAADYLNCISWMFLVVRLWGNHWISGTDYVVYTFLQMMAAGGFLLPVLFIHKKKQRILAQDTEPIYVDDDEYWKNGWYNNPHDSHLMVQDRLCGMNFSFNMAHPASWVIYGATVVLLAGTLLWLGIVLVSFHNAEVVFSLEGTEAQFEAAGYQCSFALEDVEQAELIEQLPEEKFAKINGGATEDYDIGHFRGSKSGKCMMFLRTGYTPILKITLPDKVVFVNSEKDGEVESWYEAIRENAGNRISGGIASILSISNISAA
ncbi:MAG: hypothetical protein Q4C77_09480 [Eubacteriales bacterium]|nr:hypothetical protein [Eubacteriales bacterium]